ncbi:MAG: WD40/YVTN/BNR-like repeat-containing protein, partial [Anaerolineales bacterium]
MVKISGGLLLCVLIMFLAACSISWPKVNPPTPVLPAQDSLSIPSPAPTATRLPDQVTDISAPVLCLVSDPHNPDGLYALLATNDLYYSGDQGVSWKRLPLPANPLRYDPEIQSTCPLPMQFDVRPSSIVPDLLWVRAGQSLYRSDDKGSTWQARLDNVANWAVSQDGKRLFALRF